MPSCSSTWQHTSHALMTSSARQSPIGAPAAPAAASAASTAPSAALVRGAASSGAAAGKRSSRLASQRPTSRAVLDAATRAHVAAVRLARLEQDNHVEDAALNDAAWGEQDEDEQVMQGAQAAKGKAKGKAKQQQEQQQQPHSAKRRSEADASAAGVGGAAGATVRRRQTLEEIVDRLGMREEGAEAPNYVTAAAGPCPYPPRPFCSVCGYLAAYTCVRCGLRYCCTNCQKTHQDTRCGPLASA